MTAATSRSKPAGSGTAVEEFAPPPPPALAPKLLRHVKGCRLSRLSAGDRGNAPHAAVAHLRLLPDAQPLALHPLANNDGDLAAFMQQLTNTHLKRWKEHRREIGHDHLYQGRYKCFPVQTDEYFYSAVRYVKRNALRANLVNLAEHWPWSSLALATRPNQGFSILADWPLPRPANWIDTVNRPQSEAELEALRRSVNRGCPLGDANWTVATAHLLGIQFTLRARGRPKQSL